MLSGSFNFEGINLKENEDKKNLKMDKNIKSTYQVSLGENLLRDLSQRSIIDKDNVILNGNIMFQVEADRINFNHTISVLDNAIVFFIGQDELYQQKLYYWEDYLHYLKSEWGWLIWLKAALDIYSGEIKGLYGVPSISNIREEALIYKMKNLVASGISEQIKYFYGNKNYLNKIDNNISDNNTVK